MDFLPLCRWWWPRGLWATVGLSRIFMRPSKWAMTYSSVKILFYFWYWGFFFKYSCLYFVGILLCSCRINYATDLSLSDNSLWAEVHQTETRTHTHTHTYLFTYLVTCWEDGRCPSHEYKIQLILSAIGQTVFSMRYSLTPNFVLRYSIEICDPISDNGNILAVC
jgi:hypothetical protein